MKLIALVGCEKALYLLCVFDLLIVVGIGRRSYRGEGFEGNQVFRYADA
jgi:hypothetical protein